MPGPGERRALTELALNYNYALLAFFPLTYSIMSDLSENPFEQHSAVTSSQTPPESSSPDTAGRAYTSSSAAPPAATPQLTRTPSPAPVQQPSPQQERETVNDPGIIALRGMFPDYDDLIL